MEPEVKNTDEGRGRNQRTYCYCQARDIFNEYKDSFPKSTMDFPKIWPSSLEKTLADELEMKHEQKKDFHIAGLDYRWLRQEVLRRMRRIIISKTEAELEGRKISRTLQKRVKRLQDGFKNGFKEIKNQSRRQKLPLIDDNDPEMDSCDDLFCKFKKHKM